MAETKRYYWLKLQEGFFEDETIRYIEEQENGIEYVNFYLKLCLKALKNDGKLMRLVGETLIPYDVKSLSKLTGVDVDTVRVAMALFEKIGLVKIFESGEIYLSQIDELIGKETDKAKIMRAKRAKELNGNNVTGMLPNCSEVLPDCYTENRDKSIENRDIDNKKKDKKKTDSELIKSILESVDDDLRIALESFVESRKKMHKPLTGYAFQLAYNKLQQLSPSVSEQIEIVNQAVISGWQSFYPLKKNNGVRKQPIPDYMKDTNNPFLEMLGQEKEQ